MELFPSYPEAGAIDPVTLTRNHNSPTMVSKWPSVDRVLKLADLLQAASRRGDLLRSIISQPPERLSSGGEPAKISLD